MSTSKDREVFYRVQGTAPAATPYRPLLELPGKARFLTPERLQVEVEIMGEPGLGYVRFVADLVNRQYQVMQVVATGLPDQALSFDALSRFDVAGSLRQAVAHRLVREWWVGDTYSSEQPADNPDPLWKVAVAYSAAYAIGQPPTRAVAEDLGISPNAAAQRVKRARDAGYLPPTTPGKAS